MHRHDSDQPARIPVVKMVGGGYRWPQSRKYEVVAYAEVDERDVEFLSGFVWTLAKDLKTGYANRNVWTGEKTVKIQMHREVWERHNGPIPAGLTPDHIDRNGLNNRLGNLRLADRTQQQINQGLCKNSTTGFKGVAWATKAGKFQVGIRRGTKALHFGWYDVAVEAAFVSNFVARRIYGEFAWTNPIPEGAVSEERQAELIALIERRYFPRHGIAPEPAAPRPDGFLF